MPITDPVKRKEYSRLHYLKNKEKIKKESKESSRLYYLKNKEKVNKRQRLYRLNNKEKRKEYEQTDTRKNGNRISQWKKQGILC